MLNIFLLSIKPDDRFDKIYVFGKYTYRETWNRMLLLEELTGVRQKRLRALFATVRRKYNESGKLLTKTYKAHLESHFEKALIAHYDGNWNYFWKSSNLLTKIHFFYLLLLPLSFFIGVEILFAMDPNTDELLPEMPGHFFVALPFLITVVIMFAGIMIIVNLITYYLILGVLKSMGFEKGRLNRNVNALERVIDSMKFYRNSALILGIGGTLGAGALAKGAFKGLGGGKFGGGGAGGSW